MSIGKGTNFDQGSGSEWSRGMPLPCREILIWLMVLSCKIGLYFDVRYVQLIPFSPPPLSPQDNFSRLEFASNSLVTLQKLVVTL